MAHPRNPKSRAAAAKRKALLVGSRFNKDYLKPDEFARLKGLTKAQCDGNWSSVSLSTYGPILREMEGAKFRNQLMQVVRKTNPRFNLVKMPVYACGYNWSASNYDSGRAAAQHIKTWVADARRWAADHNAQCPGAILVTHSMGGFVARSAALMHGAAGDILAVLSTVMPTDGAPAAYKRFHFGFENPGISTGLSVYVVLGRQGSLVTALLGHMPGAQELLPNKRYQSNDGSRQWLHILNPKRNLIGGQHAIRARRRLRASFAAEGPDAEARGRYFDRYILLAEGVIGTRDTDHLLLLELGWRQAVGLDGCAQFQEVTRRGKWYGRRLWLQDQLERLSLRTDDGQGAADGAATIGT